MSRPPRATPVLLVLLFALAFAGVAAGYGERPFNANPTTSGNSYTVSSFQRVAQSFQPTESFLLTNVTLEVENVGSSPLNVTIRRDAGGNPGAAVLAWSVRMGGARAWVDFPFPTPVSVALGSTYWIVAENQPFIDSYRWFHAGADVVPGGAKVHNGVDWFPQSADLGYVTYGLRKEPRIAVGMGVDRRSAAPGETFQFTVYLNNTGARAAPTAWVNLTLPSGVTYVSDTVGAVNGTRTGPTAWRVSQIPNGPRGFLIAASVDPGVAGGTVLTATVHLDYTDTAGAPQPSSTASASVIVALKTKPMYLAHDGTADKVDRLQAAAPVGVLADFDGDGFPGMTLGNTAATWTLAPAFARPFRFRGPLTLEAFVNAQNPGVTGTIAVTVSDRRGAVSTPLASVQVAVAVDGNTADFEPVTIDLGSASRFVSAGNTTELRIVKVAGDDLFLAYGDPATPTRLVATTDTYVSIGAVTISDARGPTLLFSARDTIEILVNASDPFGSSEIAGVTVDLIAPDNAPVVDDAPMALVATDAGTPSAWKRFRSTFAELTKQGNYTVLLTATEGNGVVATSAAAFTVRYPALTLVASADVQSARPGGLVRYTIRFDNGGLGSGPAWINATFPQGLTYLSDTSTTAGGSKTGALNWTFPDVGPGPHAFEIVAQVDGDPAGGTVASSVTLAYADEKGYRWTATPVSVPLEIIVLPSGPLANPFVLALIGAALAGGPAAAYLVWRSRKPVIEEVFLLHRDGLLLYHLSRSIAGEDEKDRDILGAMLTAVQDFVKDSFKYGENRDLNKLEFGDYQVVIERGQTVYVAVVLSKKAGEVEVRRRVRSVLEQIESAYGTHLEDWSGDMDDLLGVRDLAKHLVGR